jgi:hypothetical protein
MHHTWKRWAPCTILELKDLKCGYHLGDLSVDGKIIWECVKSGTWDFDSFGSGQERMAVNAVMDFRLTQKVCIPRTPEQLLASEGLCPVAFITEF